MICGGRSGGERERESDCDAAGRQPPGAACMLRRGVATRLDATPGRQGRAGSGVCGGGGVAGLSRRLLNDETALGGRFRVCGEKKKIKRMKKKCKMKDKNKKMNF